MKKIAVIGPESTGKSTLCHQLAQHYKTIWCPEFAREYLTERGMKYDYDDLLQIAKGQLALEDELAAQASNGLYLIDTNMYVMKVWAEYVFRQCPQFIIDQLADRHYDLYMLSDIDLPWTFDPLREYPEAQPRKELYCMYEDILVNQATPWVVISGGFDNRLKTAINAVNHLT